MSRDAYESFFGVAAPANALFGVDMAYPQAYSDPSTLDYNFCKGYWLDVHTWADFVCIRTSYGQGGDDGAQGLHFQIANELSYPGAKGCYHFVYARYGVQANYDNFISRSDPFADQTSFDMMDYEVAPNAGAGFINQMCDMVEQKRQRTCFVYGGKSYLDAAGAISCEADKLWIAHYASSGSNPLQPTTDWSSWGAPLMPDQYGAVLPGIWQWSSLTAQHGHLDLNISTLPRSAFGLGSGVSDDMAQVPQEQWTDLQQKVDTLFAQFGNAKYYEPGFGQSVGMRLGHRLDLTDEGRMYDFRNLSNNAASNNGMLSKLTDAVTAISVKLGALAPGTNTPVDVDKLALALAKALDISDQVAKAVASLFSDLLAQSKK